MKMQGVVLEVKARGRGGWAAAVFEASTRERIATTGFLGQSVTEGESLEVEGDWETHPKYGRQFKVSKATSIAPSGTRGLQLWLEQMPHIGFTRATQIINLLGADQALEAIKNTPERLLAIKGLTQERVAELRAAVLRREGMAEIESTLLGYKLTTSMVGAAIAHFGADKVVDVVKTTPYALCELPRVGFITADQIAQRVGVSRDSTGRGRAAARYLLQMAAKDDGHTYLTASELYWRGAALDRGVHENALRRGVRSLREDGKIVTDGERAYLREMWDAETEIASIARRMAGMGRREEGQSDAA